LKRKIWSVLKIALVGALSFWTPDTLAHAIRKYSFSSLEVHVITIAMPVTLFAALFACAKLYQLRTGTVAICMLPGIWVLGGVFMSVGASFSGGGFLGPNGFRGGVEMILMSLFPLLTFIMATYDGSLGALLLVSLILIFVWIVGRASRAEAAKESSQKSP
jgi:hypothetical protein